MAKKTIEAALKAFDEKYYTVRYPALTTSAFGSAIKQYLKDINVAVTNHVSEEHLKNITNDFLKKQLYSDAEFQINTDNGIDTTIRYNGKLFALIEAKRPSNKGEMVTESDLNRKALWEIIFYYLIQTRNINGKKLERIKDIEIRRLIVTDSISWFLIDAVDIEKLCDGYLEKHFYKYRNQQLNYANDTAKFYEDISVYLRTLNITQKLPFVYFNIGDEFRTRKNWQYIYKILNREYLLKFGYQEQRKSHQLNDRFYQELLYIMGLHEVKDRRNIVIKIDTSVKNSLGEQVYRKFVEDKDESIESATEKTFELLITWINRLLFIKLFEGQLIAFNSDEDCYHILEHDKITDLQDLKDLFFNVLGRKTGEREDTLKLFRQFSLMEHESVSP